MLAQTRLRRWKMIAPFNHALPSFGRLMQLNDSASKCAKKAENLGSDIQVRVDETDFALVDRFLLQLEEVPATRFFAGNQTLY